MADVIIVAVIVAYCIFLLVRHIKKRQADPTSASSGCCGNCNVCPHPHAKF